MSMNDVRASRSLLVAVPAVTTAEPLMRFVSGDEPAARAAPARACVTLYALHKRACPS